MIEVFLLLEKGSLSPCKEKLIPATTYNYQVTLVSIFYLFHTGNVFHVINWNYSIILFIYF